MRDAIATEQAPRAIGPYSQAVAAGGLLWCSGQLGLDPTSGQFVAADAAAQAEQCLKNLDAVCRAAGTSLAHALRCTVYLADLADFAAVNAVYERFFSPPYPARATIQAAALPRGARVEIDAVVALTQ